MPADTKRAVEHLSTFSLVNRVMGEGVQPRDDRGFSVRPGEVVARGGSSDRGKTAVLKIVHRLIGADEGAIEVAPLPPWA